MRKWTLNNIVFLCMNILTSKLLTLVLDCYLQIGSVLRCLGPLSPYDWHFKIQYHSCFSLCLWVSLKFIFLLNNSIEWSDWVNSCPGVSFSPVEWWHHRIVFCFFLSPPPPSYELKSYHTFPFTLIVLEWLCQDFCLCWYNKDCFWPACHAIWWYSGTLLNLGNTQVISSLYRYHRLNLLKLIWHGLPHT